MRKIFIITSIVMMTALTVFNPSPQSFFYYIKGVNGYIVYNPSTYRDANYLIFSKYNHEFDGTVHTYYGVLGNFIKSTSYGKK